MALLSVDEKDLISEETREASPANFLIKIEGVSLLKENGIDKYESRTFGAGAGGHKWKLIIYPEGNRNSSSEKEEEERHVSVYLTMVETDSMREGWEVTAIFTFFVHHQLLNYYHCFRGIIPWRFNGVNNKWGFSKLMSREDLMDPRKGFVVDDCCVFGAEVFVISNEERVNERLSLIKPKTPYKRDWKISGFSKLGDDDDVWSSEEFKVEGYKWTVEVYPNGDSSHAKGRYVSIFVYCIDSVIFAPHQKVKAEVCLRIKTKLTDEIDHTYNYTHWFTSSSTHWGFPAFFPIADMSSKGFLVEDCCFLEAEISVQAHATIN